MTNMFDYLNKFFDCLYFLQAFGNYFCLNRYNFKYELLIKICIFINNTDYCKL